MRLVLPYAKSSSSSSSSSSNHSTDGVRNDLCFCHLVVAVVREASWSFRLSCNPAVVGRPQCFASLAGSSEPSFLPKASSCYLKC
eukprot:5198476-Amphidinium_carterae.1